MFIAFEVSLDVIKALRPIVPVIEANDRDLADQIKRAASSVALNLGEGQRSEKGNKRKHYAIAHGSANEVRAALLTAVAWGWLSDPSEALALLDRLLALLWRLTHPCK
jgi:four helix bundle protein